jgi:hypothetical protein
MAFSTKLLDATLIPVKRGQDRLEQSPAGS